MGLFNFKKSSMKPANIERNKWTNSYNFTAWIKFCYHETQLTLIFSIFLWINHLNKNNLLKIRISTKLVEPENRSIAKGQSIQMVTMKTASKSRLFMVCRIQESTHINMFFGSQVRKYKIQHHRQTRTQIWPATSQLMYRRWTSLLW